MSATYTIQMALMRDDGRLESLTLEGRAEDAGAEAAPVAIAALLDQAQALMMAVIQARASVPSTVTL